ncbi:M20/M25/M40 family metallo-hydrolase [candidate division WOR-3 bacterium]|nr:M20/M25/M40 family metallo-hydrolase [candidate division WOR-3 bacterium]
MELAMKLCQTYGPAGREDRVREMIRSEVEQKSTSVSTDRLGNLICHVQASERSQEAKKDSLMICAHMDEIGVIITHIDEKGFLRFTGVGGVRNAVLHQKVIFENGVIGTIGAETKPQTPKDLTLTNMFIDIGASSKQEAMGKVRVGDIAAFHQDAVMMENRLVTKALDDRIGCFCCIEALKRIRSPILDIYFVFTVQEEVGLRGARTGAYALAPTYALAVDVTATGDTPECARMDVALGKGVAVKVKDMMFIANPKVNDRLLMLAENNSIPYQLEVLERGTTDAAVVQLVREGVMSGVLSIPIRYLHSVSEMCDTRDVQATIDLLVHVCEQGPAMP